jgi:hypothetical protein
MKQISQNKSSYRKIIVTLVILAVVAGLLYTAHRLDLLGLVKQLHGTRETSSINFYEDEAQLS